MGVGIACLSRVAAAQHHIVRLAGNIVIAPVDGAEARMWVSDDSSIIVNTHTPGVFEVDLSMLASGSARVGGAVPVNSVIDSSLSFSSQERPIYCYPASQCDVTLDGFTYYGFAFDPGDGGHFGWVNIETTDLGLGILVLRIVDGAYDSRVGHPIGAGELESPTNCGSADFDCDGDPATDADIEAFFACLAGRCPGPPCESSADFDNDGNAGTDADIEAFFSVLAGRPC